MNDMQDNVLTDNGVSENKTDEKMFTKADRNGRISYIEREVDRFDFDGFEVVRREWFSKANCPAVTLKYGSVLFNVRAIRKLNECRFIQILINTEKKLMIVKPCDEDDKDSLQWSKLDKHNKTVPRMIRGDVFTAHLYNDMKWGIESTVKVLATLQICNGERIFVFNLANAEAYLRLAEPSADDPKRRIRKEYMPSHWQGHYGESYEESKNQIVTTFEGVPEGFVKITLPSKEIKHNSSTEKPKEETENGTT
jgi:hypothetical protein